MKKLTLTLTSVALCATLLCGCMSSTDGSESTTSADASGSAVSEQTEGSAQADAKETKAEISYDFEKEIPEDYIMSYKDGEVGTVELITYHANDYIGDGEGCDKNAYVYLPAGYDPNGQYCVIYLMHGIGGNECEWGLNLDNSELKNILDNLIGRGDIAPLILVTPNGKALGCKHDQDFDSFYNFGYELRNDLIPYMDENYATIPDREHRAMAGLSMGGMQTINIGIGESMDLFSWFGAFSAAPTSNAANQVASDIKNSEYTLDYFYNICGTEDDIAYSSASTAAKTLPDQCDIIVPNENFTWQEQSGGHDFDIWYLGLYNFAKIAFVK